MSIETMPENQERRAHWEPQRRMTLDAARRRSSMVKILRWGFIVLAVLIVGIVTAYIIISAKPPTPVQPVQPAQPAATDPANPATNPDKPDDLTIENPVYQGTDKTGHPYVVKADLATRHTNADGTPSDITDLVNPRLFGDPNDKGQSRVTAEKGVYDSKNKTLDLQGDVKLMTPNGYVYTTDHAQALIEDDRIWGTTKVVGEGPDGAISADGFEITNNGKTIRFKGKVKTRFFNTKSASGGTK